MAITRLASLHIFLFTLIFLLNGLGQCQTDATKIPSLYDLERQTTTLSQSIERTKLDSIDTTQTIKSLDEITSSSRNILKQSEEELLAERKLLDALNVEIILGVSEGGESNEVIIKRREIESKIKKIETQLKRAKLLLESVDRAKQNLTTKLDQKAKEELLENKNVSKLYSGLVEEFAKFDQIDVDKSKLGICFGSALLIYLLLFRFRRLIYLTLRRTRGFIGFYPTKFFPFVCYSGIVIYIIFKYAVKSDQELAIIDLVSSSSLSLASISSLWCLRRVKAVRAKTSFIQTQKQVVIINSFFGLLRLATIIAIILPSLGYFNLAEFFLKNVLIQNFVVITATIFIGFLKWLTFVERYKKIDILAPSTLLITIIEPILWLVISILILSLWSLNPFMSIESLTAFLHDGVELGMITIKPWLLLESFLSFICIYAITRLLQWFLKDRLFIHTGFTESLQNTLLSLLGYIGISSAIIISLSSLGVSLQNLAFIAGALSVGIGFGLQAIFSNFVSGIIILLERPIKVGDWVFVGDLHGIVKRISVRSTEIENFDKSSIIIPNSQIISEPVKNWTLTHFSGRCDIKVGVSYSSDVNLVTTLLLNAAKANPEVIQDETPPEVLLMNFGDSSVNFELRCVIRDVRNQMQTSSKLRYQIWNLFQENGVVIPFPQREVKVVNQSWPPQLLNSTKPEDKS